MADGDDLRALPSRRIIAYVADAAERWHDADFPPRVRVTAAIEARTGYSTPVVEYALDRLFGAVTRGALATAIEAELGTLAALDGFADRSAAPPAWARGVDRVTIVSSDTTIGVAVVPAVFALCAKCGVTVKDRSDALVAAFFDTLAEEHAAFASARARTWTGGDDPDERALLGGSDTVVAFGGQDSLRAIRERCGAETRFIGYGHRASIGRLTGRDVAALTPARADALARDALLYDGEGCLSLHALFVEAEGDALTALSHRLGAAFERVAREFPAGATSPQRAAAVASARSTAAFRAASGDGALVRAGDTALVIAPPRESPPPFLPRLLPVVPVRDDGDIAAYVRAHRVPVQALGVAAIDDASVALAASVGAVRIARFGTMQDPPLAGHHGGFARVSDFVRWIDRA